MFSGRTTTTVSAPASGPMDLNEAGRPQWRELAPLFGLAFSGLLVMGIGGMIFILSRPDSMDTIGAWNTLGMALGGVCAWGGYSMYKGIHGNIIRGIARYYDRVDAWSDQMLDERAQGDGKVIAQQVSEWAYNPMDLRSLLLAYAAILFAQPRQLTIDLLTSQGLWIKVDHHDVSLMTFTQDSAAQFLNLLAEARVIQGRGPRQAGALLVDQPKEQLGRLLKLASRDPSVLATMQTRGE